MLNRLHLLVSIFILTCMLCVPAFGYNPKLVSLNVGETTTNSFGGAQSHTIKVIGFQEFSEKGYWQGGMRDILYKSLVTVEVDGVQGVVGVGPYYMPTVINGVRIGGEITKGFSNSYAISPMSKDVQLTAKDASLPWYEPGTFAFPLKEYRWGSAAFENAWLGFHDMADGKLYYHAGVDLGGLHPNQVELVSMMDQATISSWGERTRFTNNSLGLSIRNNHMIEQYLRSDLGNGSVLDKGEMFGYLGGTADAAHVHIDAWYGNQVVNIHPMLVQAYMETYNEPIAFPGHKRHAFVNGNIELDGSNSVAPDGRSIVSYLWQFTDGTTATTPTISRKYTAPGTYSEELTITDSTGAKSTNSVMVFVYDPTKNVDAPYLQALNHWPTRDIKPGEQVLVNFYARNVSSNISLDFGDGTVQAVGGGGVVFHAWQSAGEYTLTYEADGPGGHGIFKQRVIVVPEPATMTLIILAGFALLRRPGIYQAHY